jgi:Zn-finger nucleic acid-binding protein
MPPRRRRPTAESTARAERIANALAGLLEDPPARDDRDKRPAMPDPYRPIPAARRTPTGPAGLSCPGCGTTMHVKFSDAVQLDVCRGCGGLWFDPGELDAVVEPPVNPPVSLGQLRQQMSGLPGARPDARVYYRNCPRCQNPMNRRNFAELSGVVMDECPRHGVFLDPEELEAIETFVRLGGLALQRKSSEEVLRARERRAETLRLEAETQHQEFGHAHRRVWWQFFDWFLG